VLKIMKIIFGAVTLLLAGYGLITKNFEFQPFMIFFLGIYILIMGLEEFKKGRKRLGYLAIAVCLFVIFVSLQGLILN
jgi:hypothetical protein